MASAVARKPEAELGSALNRLIQAGLVFRQGAPTHATYLFKHTAKISSENNYGTTLPPLGAFHRQLGLGCRRGPPYGKIRLNTNGWDRGSSRWLLGA